MARRDRKGRIWRGYRRPVLRDGVFWFAGLVAVAGIVVQAPLAGWKGGTVDWIVLVLEVGLTIAAAYIVVGVLAATVRGVGEGWRTAERAATASAAAPKPSTPPTAAPTASSPGPEPAPDPAPEPSTPGPEPAAPPKVAPAPGRPAVGVAMEKKARILGRAVGAAKRTYQQYDSTPPDPP
jgi:hypothetical protein